MPLNNPSCCKRGGCVDSQIQFQAIMMKILPPLGNGKNAGL